MANANAAKLRNSHQSSEWETPTTYFRKIFLEDPGLLKSGNNSDLLQRWLADHPDQHDIPKKVRVALSNAKTVLRKKLRKRRGQRFQSDLAQPMAPGSVGTKGKISTRGFVQLEEQIDDCLTFAKGLDRDALGDVIRLLRKARNEVVCKQGR